MKLLPILLLSCLIGNAFAMKEEEEIAKILPAGPNHTRLKMDNLLWVRLNNCNNGGDASITAIRGHLEKKLDFVRVLQNIVKNKVTFNGKSESSETKFVTCENDPITFKFHTKINPQIGLRALASITTSYTQELGTVVDFTTFQEQLWNAGYRKCLEDNPKEPTISPTLVKQENSAWKHRFQGVLAGSLGTLAVGGLAVGIYSYKKISEFFSI